MADKTYIKKLNDFRKLMIKYESESSEFLTSLRANVPNIMPDTTWLSITTEDAGAATVGFAAIKDGNGFKIVKGKDSLVYESRTKDMETVRFQTIAGQSYFKTWVDSNNIYIDYKNLCVDMWQPTIDYMNITFPGQARTLDGIETYSIYSPASNSTLCVARRDNDTGTTDIWLNYNPQFVIDTIASDITIGKYGIDKVVPAFAYMLAHEMEHLMRGHLTDWGLGKVKALVGDVPNRVEDLGINNYVSKQSGLDTIDSGIAPGHYVSYTVLNSPDKLILQLKNMLTIYLGSNYANEAISSLSGLKIGDNLRFTMGQEMIDIEKLLSTLNTLCSDRLLVPKADAIQDIEQSVKNKKKKSDPQKPNPVDLNLFDLVILGGTGGIYVLSQQNADGSYQGVYLGQFDSYVLLKKMADDPLYEKNIAMNPGKANILTIKPTTEFLCKLVRKSLTPNNVFRAGDVIKVKSSKESCVVVGVTSQGIDATPLPAGTPAASKDTRNGIIMRIIENSTANATFIKNLTKHEEKVKKIEVVKEIEEVEEVDERIDLENIDDMKVDIEGVDFRSIFKQIKGARV